MNNILSSSQSNGTIYNWMAQIQSEYSQYIHLKNQYRSLDDHLKMANDQFDRFPTQQNLHTLQNIWNQKLQLMQQISHMVNSIVSRITEATKLILTSMLSSIDVNNQLSILLNDNAIGSIYSLVEQNQYQLDIRELYRQSCLLQNILSLLNNIEIKAQMMRLSLPNFENLKRLIRDY